LGEGAVKRKTFPLPVAFTDYDADVLLLVNALRGIASCGTNCGCCRMHHDIAAEAVERWERWERTHL
jgi:hypothetical protein